MASRSWCFTWNNPEVGPDQVTFLLIECPIHRYSVFQLEEGEEHGTPHYQGYIELTSPRRISYMKALFGPVPHWETRRGSRDQARTYCMKQETRQDGPWELGDWQAGSQGRRNDIRAFKNAIQEGASKSELVEDHPLMMAKYPKFYNTVRMMTMPVRQTELEVRLNYGRTGTGKTRYVYDTYREDGFYMLPVQSSGTIWFDGYDRDDVVLLDDFCGKYSKMPLGILLRILDRYPIIVPVKGAFTWWMPNIIIITTNIHPEDWYDWEDRREQFHALCRRFNSVYYYLEAEAEPEQIDVVEFFNDEDGRFRRFE